MDKRYIEFEVQHQTITRTDVYDVVGNSQNYLYARFSFCNEWEDIAATAVFSTNSGNHYSAVIEDGECLVPWEVLRSAEFWVGVFGGDRMTTSTTRVPVKPGVKLNASPGVQPTPSAYEILMRELRDGVAKVDEQAETVEGAAAQAAESAEAAKSAKEAAVEALDSFMSSNTPIINDLTTGGTAAALSAEMGKVLNSGKINKSDKPAGTYAGTGDAAAQVIDTKGTGRGIFIYGGRLAAIVAPNGAVCWTTANGTVTTLPHTEVAFANGVLTIATTSFYVNSSGVNYAYQVF